ncbi:MAG: S-methyl-5-thioribose-1-phosphate isomerase [Candidatus Aminicenantes bacterium]|nr:MAG: S-methyl-5-thioribose-1-phosphate isomerase [Candidatus Aminicenantes bacterium]
MLPTIKWDENKVIMIDQRKLPGEEVYVECQNTDQVAEAIEKMVIRGAPAIGVAAAFGVALGVLSIDNDEKLDEEFARILHRLEITRPTARNLFWALERMKGAFERNKGLELSHLKEKLIQEALDIEAEDVETNRKIGFYGKELIEDDQSILTHCNAGALATAGYGTALGVIRAAFQEGKKICVFADETRPFLQGARLTCWELHKENIPVVLITDSMAGYFMQKGEIALVITGADRITRNGDAANKIGTYSLAVLAKEHSIPFYVAAPFSTIDFNLNRGSEIPIEERDPQEVREVGGHCLSLADVKVKNPAFDVTPAKYISAIITEKGTARPPYGESLEELNNVKEL